MVSEFHISINYIKSTFSLILTQWGQALLEIAGTGD